jgi:hypothetical protein
MADTVNEKRGRPNKAAAHTAEEILPDAFGICVCHQLGFGTAGEFEKHEQKSNSQEPAPGAANLLDASYERSCARSL